MKKWKVKFRYRQLKVSQLQGHLSYFNLWMRIRLSGSASMYDISMISAWHMSYIMCMTYVWHVYDICMPCVWHMYDNDEEDWPVLCTPLASATPSASASSPPVEPSWGKSSYCLHLHHIRYPLPLCISDPNKVVFPSDSKVCYGLTDRHIPLNIFLDV